MAIPQATDRSALVSLENFPRWCFRLRQLTPPKAKPPGAGEKAASVRPPLLPAARLLALLTLALARRCGRAVLRPVFGLINSIYPFV